MTLYALGACRPALPDDCDFWVAPDANVVGNVILQSGSSIWFGSTLRGDNESITIGAGSNVQENCVFHTDMGAPLTIGENCTIGHKAMLHGCTIGEGSLIGMGATVLNHARIGRFSPIGAGALVTEGKEIPDFSLANWARPARWCDNSARTCGRSCSHQPRITARTCGGFRRN